MTDSLSAGPSAQRVTGAPPSDPIGDAVRAFQAGRSPEESFRRIYERYFRSLLGFFSRKGFKQEDCFDLTQETFVGIYQGLEAYHHEDRFEAWLYRIATTTYLKKIRAGSAAKRSGTEISKDAGDLPGKALASRGGQLADLLDAERLSRLSAAIEGLPPQMRRCLSLQLGHDLSYREIAAVLKLSVETVKAHLARARKKLREELGDGLGDEGPQGGGG